ncbi:MAG TPA: MFS transporter [Anaerolineae bacterium]|nr:MFS transporter [Anaerolineae bacterium]
MFRNRLVLVFLFVFIDLLGYSLFLPLLPFYASALGASAFLVGILIASNALAQLIVTPVVGRLSDKFGRRPLLIFSISGTLLSFLLLGLVEPLGRFVVTLASGRITLAAATVAMLFLSRILDGLFGGDVSLARAYVTDITDEKNRAKGLGMIGAAFGLGFIVGPAIGGTLANWSYATSAFAAFGLPRYAVPAFAAAALAALNLVAVILWLPESLAPEERARLARSPRAAFTARCLWECISRPRFGTLLRIRLLYMLAFTLFTANFALWAQYQLRVSDQTTSYVLTYVGIIIVLVQGVAIGRLTNLFSDARLILGGAVLLAATLFAWAFVPNLALLLLVITPLPLAGGVLNTVTNSAITKAVYPEEVGGALGLSASLDSLARVIAPAMAGLMLQQLGSPSLGLLGALIAAIVILHSWRRLVVHPDPDLPERDGEAAPRPSTQQR